MGRTGSSLSTSSVEQLQRVLALDRGQRALGGLPEHQVGLVAGGELGGHVRLVRVGHDGLVDLCAGGLLERGDDRVRLGIVLGYQLQLQLSASGATFGCLARPFWAGSWKFFFHTLNDVPQPHVLLAFGLLKTNPRLTRLVS